VAVDRLVQRGEEGGVEALEAGVAVPEHQLPGPLAGAEAHAPAQLQGGHVSGAGAAGAAIVVVRLLGTRAAVVVAELVAEAGVDPLEVDELLEVRAVVVVKLLDLPRQPLVALPQVPHLLSHVLLHPENKGQDYSTQDYKRRN